MSKEIFAVESLKEDKKAARELHQLGEHLPPLRDTEKLIFDLINQFDNASEDKIKLEIAGRLISLIQKVML